MNSKLLEVLDELDKCLPMAEINRRLHLFNLSTPRDWSLFADIPQLQQVNVMYPEVVYPLGLTEDERKQYLIEMFGPL